MIAGKTMIQRTYERAKQAKLLDALIVATDDQRIVDAVTAFGGEARMTSDQCLTGSDRCWELYSDLVAADASRNYGIVVNIQGDEPLVDPEHIDALIDALRTSKDVKIAACAAPIDNKEDAVNPNVTKVVMDSRQYAIYFSRALIPNNKQGEWRESVKYFKNCGMYCYRANFLKQYCDQAVGPLQASEDLEQLKVLEMGERMKMVVVDYAAPGIDTPEQL